MKTNKQSGNSLWFILVAIGLLGLLTIMMSRSSSTNNDTGDYEQNVITANEILSYAKSMEVAVQNLLARGCGENDISFWQDSDGNGTENPSDTYFNNDAPPDRSCHIFDVAGTGMTWIIPKSKWLDSSEDASANYGEFILNSRNTIKNLETDSRTDLLILLKWVDAATCRAINSIVFSDSAITEDPLSFELTPDADGNFSTGAENIDLSSLTLHEGEPSACFSSQIEGGFHFYHALHAR